MAKVKKKRTKRYQGADAKQVQPMTIRVQAVKRSKHGQWWHDNKKRIKTALLVALVVFILGWMITELVRLFV